VEIAQLVFLIAGWLLLPGSPLRWTALALAAVAAPWIIAFLLAALRPPRDASWRAYYSAVGRDLRVSAQQVGLAVAFLPHQAWVSADAIVRTWYRMAISRRHLLEWQAAAQAAHTDLLHPETTWRLMRPAVVLAAALAAVAMLPGAHGPDTLPPWRLAAAALPILALWGAAPMLARFLSAPVPRGPRLAVALQAQALRYARLHWAYFERFATATTHWLIPDNYQDEPLPVVAMRTSPTNIGLQLLATTSARDLRFISTEEMVERLEAILASMDRMERLHGHFFNWYDLHDLRVLAPAYISTVDSGNLAGHLIALRQACLALRDGTPLDSRLASLAERAYAHAMAMDFSFLYDPQRKLLAIGYQHDIHALDEPHYDLLASEARLASFVAIAKRDVPVEHWFRLDRTLTQADGETALISWSGSMFEYLMPTLVMRTYPSTLLDQTCRAAVRRHIRHGAVHHVPWGVSESAYNVRDRYLTYQYRAFGVPDLALKRGLGQDLVIAPYASILAMQVEPERALANLDRLETAQALGPFGFRDAIDYSRPDPEGRGAVVATVMAHHVGMSLVALTNTLTAEVWQRRFHDDALVRAAELLLHERIPRRFLLQAPQAGPTQATRATAEATRSVVREVEDPLGAASRIAMLGRAPYTVMITSAGGGPSQFEEIAVTRWRPDATADDTGQFCYVRNLTAGRTWSVAHQPTAAVAEAHRVVLANDRVTFERVDGEIETRTEIVVVPEDAAEVRRVTITNTGTTVQEVELTSYGEIVLAPQGADRAHPAFSNLFVETEWHDWCSAITATRRPRSDGERRLWCVHVVDSTAPSDRAVSCETDRARFIGRGRSVRHPIAMDASGPLSGTTGPVLDPIFSLRTTLRLGPGQTTSVAFTTLVATTRDRALEMAGRYHDVHAAQRAFDLAAMSTEAELRDLEMTSADAALFQDIAAHLLRGTAAMRSPQEELRQDVGGQPMLWSLGLSGDHPIVLASIADEAGLPTLRQLFAAHRFWRLRGMTVDLLVLNTRPTGYLLELDTAITAGIFAVGETVVLDRPGGVFVRRQDQLDVDELLMLRSSARLVVPCDGRALASWLDARAGEPMVEPARQTASSAPARAGPEIGSPRAVQAVPSPPLTLDNGIGGLTPEGDYLIRLQGDRLPPAPWANVVANPHGGFIVTERGGGNTWSGNSHFYRLTPWRNDPVTDPCGEALYLRDEVSGAAWSVTPGPMDSGEEHQVLHAAGYSTFRQEHRGLRSKLTLGMVPDEPIKVSRLELTNTSGEQRRVTVTAYAEWTLGALREHARHHVVTRFVAEHGAILAHNGFDPQFAGRVAFHALDSAVFAHTADRTEFLGRQGTPSDPAALRRGAPVLRSTTGVGHDPCSVLQREIVLAPGERHEVVTLLGTAEGDDAAMAALARHRVPGVPAAAVSAAVVAWQARLSVIAVTTPEPSFDAMVNRWTLYQALSCRMWARSAVYQSGGAYGFRDQLQDVMAFVHAEPTIARDHILRAAGRQFVEGDVQHWWHSESGRGTRTRFSDDLAWLPHVVDHYVRVSGDAGILDATAPFLVMRELAPGEQEVYDRPTGRTPEESLHEHCLRALRRACTVGPHGLPLIGSGDWNDGMSDVGTEGRGESIWLAWFLIDTLRGYAEHAVDRGELAVAGELTDRAGAYLQAVEREGWDGAWYRRAYFDDGTPLGSSQNAECMIDAIAQSWSVLSAAGAPGRQVQAMESLAEHLVRTDARVIALLTPPFDAAPRNPGYIRGYLPGVRENGAQYTHAALWAVLAAARLGDGDRAFAWFQYLNPLTHTDTPDGVRTYKVEPYVVAADVYTASGHLGRGGWTWYTGAASWMYRTALEGILGFTRRGATLTLTPRVPAAWPGFRIDYRFGNSTYRIEVRLPEGTTGGELTVTVDGEPQLDGTIGLVDDGGTHHVVCLRS
jgi:cyclic beta-1,2-glucan synthetase